jgi:hypothetical protein
MKCTKCETDSQDIYDTDFGLLCWGCYWARALARMTPTARAAAVSQKEILESVGEPYKAQFLNTRLGTVAATCVDSGCKKMPSRTMFVGYYDEAKKSICTAIAFGCS